MVKWAHNTLNIRTTFQRNNVSNSGGTVNQLIFVAVNFRVLLMEYHFAAVNVCIYLACLISLNGSRSAKFLQRFMFAKISVP